MDLSVFILDIFQVMGRGLPGKSAAYSAALG
jgi:hypothetical protein